MVDVLSFELLSMFIVTTWCLIYVLPLGFCLPGGKNDVWVINCFHDHPLLYTTAHFSSSSSPPALFYFCGDLRLSFFINREGLVGSIVLLIFFLFLFLGCNWGKAFSRSSYCPKLNSPHTPFSYLAPPKPDISHCFGIGSPHSALFHLMTCIFCCHHSSLCSSIY